MVKKETSNHMGFIQPEHVQTFGISSQFGCQFLHVLQSVLNGLFKETIIYCLYDEWPNVMF